MADTERQLPIPGWILAVGLGLLLALWTLYPAWLDLDHVLVGDWRHPDMPSNHWLYAWIGQRLSNGESILHNTDYYFPVGDHPWLAGNGSDAVFHLPFYLLFGWPGSVTAWMLAVLTANCVAGYALCRANGAGVAGSLFGGATLGLLPYACHELAGGRFSQVPIWAFAGFLAGWIRLQEKPSWGLGVFTGLLYGACAFLYWYYGLWAALVALVFAKRPSPQVILCGVVAALTTLPPLIVFAKNWALIPGTSGEPSPHPLAIASGLPFTFPIWGGEVERGEVILSASSVFLAFRKPFDKRWAGVAIAFFLLALGPELLLPDGSSTGIPGPFRLVYGLGGPLQRYWWPYRHALVVAMAAAVLAARQINSFKLSLGLIALLPLELELRDGRATAPSAWWEAPEAYKSVATFPAGAVLELPISPQVATSQQTLLYQLVHKHPLVNGHAMWVDRVRPDEWDAWVAKNSFFTVLQQYERGQLFGPFAFRPEHVLALRKEGVRWLVVNSEYFPRALAGLVDRYKTIFGQLFGDPVYTFRDHLYVWDLEAYNHQGLVEVEPFGLPAEYFERDGNQMLDVGHGRSLGLRGLARLFPPTIPPKAQEGEGDDLGGDPSLPGPGEVDGGNPEAPPPGTPGGAPSP